MCRIIVKEFSAHELLPVKIDKVAQSVIERGFVTRIVYHPEDEDPALLAGMFIQSLPAPYLEQSDVADIVFSTQMTPYEQRLVACKEILHAADDPQFRTANRKSVDLLISQIALSTQAQKALSLTAGAAVDKFGMVNALAVLMPEAARSNLKPAYDSGKITIEDIADLAEIPAEWLYLVMHDGWDGILDLLLKDEE